MEKNFGQGERIYGDSRVLTQGQDSLFTNAKFDFPSCGIAMEDKSDSYVDQHHDSSRSSSSNAGSPNNSTSAIPTCIVAPTANDGSSDGGNNFIPSRKQREFIPENRKDNHYWEKRRKNNEAARRSREKRRLHDVVLENRIVDLTRDNCQLRNELFAIKKKFGVPLNETITFDDDNVTNKPETNDSNNSSAAVNLSSGNTNMPGYGNSARAGHPSLGLSAHQPPTMVPMQSAIPMSVPLHGNYSSKVPMPYYMPVPSSEGYHPMMSSPGIPVTRHTESESPYSPKPAHAKPKQEYMENDHDLSSNRRQLFYSSGIPSDTQGRQPNIYSAPATSHITSSYSSSNMAAVATSKSFAESDTMRPRVEDMSDDNYSQDEPLSLTVRKRGDSFSGNESSNSYSSADSPISCSPPTMALPHKLRHKMPTDFGSTFANTSYSSPVINGLAQLSEIALAQSSPLPLLKKSRYDDSGSNGQGSSESGNGRRAGVDPKYVERRKRNNEAARKCRENRKTLTKIREAKSDYLESQNSKLRTELDQLQSEMRHLKEMINKKRESESKGASPDSGSHSDNPQE